MTLSIGVDLLELTDSYVSPAASLAALDTWSAFWGNAPAAVGIKSSMGSFSQPAPGTTGSSCGFPEFDLMTGLASRGCTPVIWMEPTGTNAQVWTNWIAGNYWDDIDRWCTQYRQWTRLPAMVGLSTRVIFRFAQEMNANFMPWNSTRVSPTVPNPNGNTPANFKAAWRLLHDRIRVVNGCTDVGLYYCPWYQSNATYTPAQMWPGPTYVQYCGPDAYSGVTSGDPDDWATTVPSMRALNNAWYADYLALDPLVADGTIPLVIGETGVIRTKSPSATQVPDADRAQWWSGSGWTGSGAVGGYDWVNANEPLVRLSCYFDISGFALFDDGSHALSKAAFTAALASYHSPLSSTLTGPLYARSGTVSFA